MNFIFIKSLYYLLKKAKLNKLLFIFNISKILTVTIFKIKETKNCMMRKSPQCGTKHVVSYSNFYTFF